jgi:hypothetical protein
MNLELSWWYHHKENLEYERIIKDKTLVDEVTYKEAKLMMIK